MLGRITKYLGLAVFAAVMLSLGYVTASHAGTIFGRNYDTWADGNGYFFNQLGSCPGFVRDDVMPGGISNTMNTATEFIDSIEVPLRTGDQQHRTGAAFVIQTMRGETVNRNKPPTAAQIADWEARVRYAESQGRIRWAQTFTFTLNSCYQGNANPGAPDDDMFWDEIASGYGVQTALGIQFLNQAGGVAYELQYSCANPLGIIGGIPAPPDYTITGRTTVSDTTVIPGQSVTFQHFIKNSGPDSVAALDWSTHDPANNARPLRTGTIAIAGGREINVNTETFTVPAAAAFGTQYCRYVAFSPATDGTGSGQGATVCTLVVAQFSLTPTAIPNTGTAQQNDQVTFTYAVNVTGPTRSTRVTCKVAGQVHGPGYTPLPQQDNDRNPAVVPPPALNCDRELPIGNNVVGSELVDVGNVAPGSRICRTLVVNPRDQDGGFRSSAEGCVTIAKSPYVQFMGNDVWAGGGFAAVNPACNSPAKIETASHSLRSGDVAGSGVEYAAFALDQILSFGSGNEALADPAAAQGKSLTFSNLDSNNLGFYGAPQHCITDYVATYTKTVKDTSPAAIDVGAEADGTNLDLVGSYSFSGNMPAGSRQAYLVEGDVTIDDDIKYPANYNGPSEIPSLLIIATGNITVKRDVRQVDGIYVARGQFFTCNVPVGTTLSVNPPCEKQLVVNGSIIAGQVQLLRTYGADGSDDTQRKVPAEIFNFNAELYLNNVLYGSGKPTLQILDELDLPPRF
jgi:hypothetical protein